MPLSTLPRVPVYPGTKKPALLRWSKADPSDLQLPIPAGYNSAIRCDTIVVVDIDCKPENADKATLDMEDMAERVFACETFVVKSRSGNPHAYFELDERMAHWKRRIGLFGFVDVCTGSNSLVIAPGSTVDGKTYEVYRDQPIQRMPNWLFKQIDSQMVALAKTDKERLPEDMETMKETEEDLCDLLTEAGYKDPMLARNAYGGYDILFGYPHTCPITEHHHDKIDGYLFKAKDGTVLAGCYSHRCKGCYKKVHENLKKVTLETLIDRAKGTNGAHHDVAMVVKEMLGNQIKHIDDKLWYVWDSESGLWREDRGGKQIRIELSTTVCSAFMARANYWNMQSRHLTDEESRKEMDERHFKPLLDIAKRLKDNYFKSCIVRECETLLNDAAILELLDENTNIMGFKNGVYDFSTGIFRKGRPEDYVTMSVGYDFPETASIKTINQVRKVFADPFETDAMAHYILSVIASCMDGRRRFQEYYIWTGRGSNGKSTIQELLMQTFGDYAKPIDVAFWTKSRRETGGALPELADKKGVRFVFSNEPEASDKIQVSKIKEVTGGERITARKLYQQPITYRPQFGIFILCNDLPELSKHDGGIERRTRVLPFKHQFRQNPLPGQRMADPCVMEACRNNQEWHKACMHILLDVYKEIRNLHTIPLPQEVLDASRSFMDENNPVGLWLAEHYEITHDEEDRIPADDMWNTYKMQVDRNMNRVQFARCMTETNGVPKKLMRINDGHARQCFYGIRAVTCISED